MTKKSPPKGKKAPGAAKKPAGKKAKGHGKASTHPRPLHAATVATGITVPLGRGMPHRSAWDIQKLPSFYKL